MAAFTTPIDTRKRKEYADIEGTVLTSRFEEGFKDHAAQKHALNPPIFSYSNELLSAHDLATNKPKYKTWTELSYNHKLTKKRLYKMPRTYKRRGQRSQFVISKDGNYGSRKQVFLNKATGELQKRPNFARSQPRPGGLPALGDPTTEQGWDAELYGYSAALAKPHQKLNRKMHGYTGRGLYEGQGRLRRKMGAGQAMNRARGYIGGGLKLASTLNNAASVVRGLSGGGLYSGQGVYDQIDNSLIEGGLPSMTVHGQNDETDDISFTMEEWVKPIFAPAITSGAGTFSGYNSQIVQVNPGLQNFCPKLAAVAANYTHYEIHQLVFKYKTKVNESNVNNGISGDVMMTFNYDPANDTYDSVSDVMQSSGRAMGRIIDSFSIGVECEDGKSKNTKYFCRTCPVPIGRDVDEFDHGSLLIATNNIPQTYSNTAIGDLWCYYTVTLKQFKPGSSKLNNQQRDLFVDSCGVGVGIGEAAGFFDTSNGTTKVSKTLAIAQQSNLGGQLSSTAAGVLLYTFPADVEGFFEITLLMEGGSLTRSATAFTVPTVANIGFINDLYGGGAASSSSAASDAPGYETYIMTTSNVMAVCRVRVRAALPTVNNTLTITLSGGGATGTYHQWSLDVKELTQNTWQSRNVQVPKFVNVSSGMEVSV